ncbi:RES family NAD+ phosphorylase [Thalassospira xianhensis]|uniref:RES family NAD+ phosphorylase n=1 Tax=Thalassospira xianhensis TaxID=478503 RepID=UPI000DEDE960|nr:RES family NAD+ phosphorylase [Thalassospira xianhensis]
MGYFKSWADYYSFQLEVRLKQRYMRSKEAESFLAAIKTTSKSRVQLLGEKRSFWRAQVGITTRETEDDPYEIECAFPPERMKPLRGKATEGRANPRGIPYLYLATTKETAMSEVRPWIGAEISVAHFVTARELQIVDCSRGHDALIPIFETPKPEEVDDLAWAEIAKAFSKPTTQGDQTADYVPTQIIAELLKIEGYDGIAYKSQFGENGFNVVLFDIDDAYLVSCGIYKVKNIQMNFSQQDNPYFCSRPKNL